VGDQYKEGITVVTPTILPRADFLAEAVKSVKDQFLPAEDHIIVYDMENEGAEQTRNRGLFQVDTEWTAFLDDDDFLYPAHLASCYRFAVEGGYDLVYPWFYVKNGVDVFNEFGSRFDPEKLRVKNFIPVTYLVKTELAHKIGGFPLPNSKSWPHPTCMDWGFLLGLLDAGAKIEHLAERTWVYRWHSRNTSGELWTRIYDDYQTGRQKTP
jgi:glycosyltransferase involved in cell wall biosynthesis